MNYDLSNMFCLDVYLASLEIESKEYHKIGNQIKPLFTDPKPLLSWDISNTNYLEKTKEVKKQRDFRKIVAFAKKYQWENDISSLFSQNDFEAIILTDSFEKIIWVNEGFTKMTGYPKNFAIHKKPTFLQGKDTSKEVTKQIRLSINKANPFEVSIINYKKDTTPYHCQVKIVPLYANKKITHFIALENQKLI